MAAESLRRGRTATVPVTADGSASDEPACRRQRLRSSTSRCCAPSWSGSGRLRGRMPSPGLPPRPSPAAAEPDRRPHGRSTRTGRRYGHRDGGHPREPEFTAPDPTVADLVARSQAGEPEAFGLLYDRYVDLVYRYIYYRVGSPTLAEDLVSETFLRALRRIDSFTWQGRDFAAWLVTIARNLIADHFKSGPLPPRDHDRGHPGKRAGADHRRAGKPGARLA